MALDYFREETPLGTVGSLARIELPPEPFIVMNGDVLCDISFGALLDAHRRSGAELTIATFLRVVRDELGILERDGDNRLVAYHEKPEHEYLVSMGIYAFDPAVVGLIPPSGMDFPDLVRELLERERPVHSYTHDGYWLDLGRPDDFARANEEFEKLQPRLAI